MNVLMCFGMTSDDICDKRFSGYPWIQRVGAFLEKKKLKEVLVHLWRFLRSFAHYHFVVVRPSMQVSSAPTKFAHSRARLARPLGAFAQ